MVYSRDMITLKDLKQAEETVGYGAKVSIECIDDGIKIDLYADVEEGRVGGSLRLSGEEVDNTEMVSKEIRIFSLEAEKLLDARLGGKYLK